ncbi:hypothetical protein Anas_09380 [Armadillidium nasatum]|uniref:Uncharacterized protein n=1 Tax=Armadillidium nasatum TaxID=96803 RepID=A0A5N5T6W0_9CRUS|nr:hypothetical protein Anas_09380 [Armadillidium nasatum]
MCSINLCFNIQEYSHSEHLNNLVFECVNICCVRLSLRLQEYSHCEHFNIFVFEIFGDFLCAL